MEKNEIIDKVLRNSQWFDEFKKRNDVDNMIKSVYNMRVYHGELCTEVYKMKSDASRKEDSRELNKLYSRISVYESMIGSCHDIIVRSEDQIKNLMLANAHTTESDSSPIISNSIMEVKKSRCKDMNPDLPTLINFHTTWCGYSIKFMPLWKELKEEYCERINFIDIPCDNRKDISKKFKVSSFPTVKMFSDGKVREFVDKRNKENLTKFIEEFIKE